MTSRGESQVPKEDCALPRDKVGKRTDTDKGDSPETFRTAQTEEHKSSLGQGRPEDTTEMQEIQQLDDLMELETGQASALMHRDPLSELAKNTNQADIEGILASKGTGVGRWKRLAREVHGKENKPALKGLGNTCKAGTKRASQHTELKASGDREAGFGKRVKSTISPEEDALNSPKVEVASLDWPQSNQ